MFITKRRHEILMAEQRDRWRAEIVRLEEIALAHADCAAEWQRKYTALAAETLDQPPSVTEADAKLARRLRELRGAE